MLRGAPSQDQILYVINSGKLPGMIWWATGPQAARYSTRSPPLLRIRSLPLASFAKVTNLDNGRSVIVKINDRGPYTHGRILDLSPRAGQGTDRRPGAVIRPVPGEWGLTHPSAAALLPEEGVGPRSDARPAGRRTGLQQLKRRTVVDKALADQERLSRSTAAGSRASARMV